MFEVWNRRRSSLPRIQARKTGDLPKVGVGDHFAEDFAVEPRYVSVLPFVRVSSETIDRHIIQGALWLPKDSLDLPFEGW